MLNPPIREDLFHKTYGALNAGFFVYFSKLKLVSLGNDFYVTVLEKFTKIWKILIPKSIIRNAGTKTLLYSSVEVLSLHSNGRSAQNSNIFIEGNPSTKQNFTRSVNKIGLPRDTFYTV